MNKLYDKPGKLIKFIIYLFIFNLALMSSSNANTLKLCQTTIEEMLLITKFPQKRKIFTQIQPECIIGEKGNVIFKMTMYANKNNDSSDDRRIGMINAYLKVGLNQMCQVEEFKILRKLFDIRASLRLEEDLTEIGFFDINDKNCLIK